MADALDRFVAAQAGVYDQVLAELRGGDKRGHWMWFVFPQIAGLGRSAMAHRYAIRDVSEARAYLAHSLLGPRLVETAGAMLGWAGKRSAAAVLGKIDATKLRSSMTLFEAAGFEAAGFEAAGFEAAGGDAVFGRVIDGFFGERDSATLARIRPD